MIIMPQIDPPVKISGNLNNCAFNCALPTILSKIQAISIMDQGQLERAKDQVYLNYKQLKNIFAEHYGLNPTELTWLRFENFLAPLSFLQQEILFAPVFRSFIDLSIPQTPSLMAVSGKDTSMWLNPKNEILNQGINPSGKYEMLDTDTVLRGFYDKFGIQAHVYNYDNALQSYNLLVHEPSDVLGAEVSLNVYFKLGHFELQEHEGINMIAYNDSSNLLTGGYKAVYVATSENADCQTTILALNELRTEVTHELLLGHANFQLKCMIGLAAAGAILICVAICVCPPVAAIVLGAVGVVALLASTGLFAQRQIEFSAYSQMSLRAPGK